MTAITCTGFALGFAMLTCEIPPTVPPAVLSSGPDMDTDISKSDRGRNRSRPQQCLSSSGHSVDR